MKSKVKNTTKYVSYVKHIVLLFIIYLVHTVTNSNPQLLCSSSISKSLDWQSSPGRVMSEEPPVGSYDLQQERRAAHKDMNKPSKLSSSQFKSLDISSKIFSRIGQYTKYSCMYYNNIIYAKFTQTRQERKVGG